MIERLSGAPSPVAGRDSPWGFAMGVAGVFGLGLVVFVSLSAGRHADAHVTPPRSRPIPLAQVMPPAPQPASPQVMAPAPVQEAPPTGPDADALARLRAPAMVVDLSEPDVSAAARRTNTARVAPQGAVISAVLQTAIRSDLPGAARAVVSRDVGGFDGATVVIPRGSRLLGEFKTGVALGRSRAFVIWTRLLTPDGVSITLGSPGAGGPFLQRFGAAILVSVIDGGVRLLADPVRNSSGVNAPVIGSSQQAANVAAIALQKDIPTAITVPPGRAIRILVSRDLDVSSVISARRAPPTSERE